MMQTNRLGLFTALCVLALSHLPVYGQEQSMGGVTVFHRVAQMEIADTGKGPRQSIPVQIEGSAGLKVAFLARATGGITTVPLNMFDSQARDNTTPRAYAQVADTWSPVLYRADRFHYNSSNQTVRAQTMYQDLVFYGRPTPGNNGMLSLRNFVIYRGEDIAPPRAPTGVVAEAARGGVKLSWKAAHDNVGVAKYVISRANKGGEFVKVAEAILPEYVDPPPTVGDYSYRILAVDFQDNLSPWSTTSSVTVTKALFPTPGLSDYERDRLGYAQHIRNIHAAGKGNVLKGRVFQFGDSLTGALLYMLQTEAALGRYIVQARGRAGWTTSQGSTIIANDISQMNPEFCLILYGTNNRKSQGANKEAMNDLLAMAKGCEVNGTVPIIATIPPRGFTDPKSGPEARYNSALIKMCRENKIPIAYLFEEFQARPDRRKLLANDGIHWAHEGFFVTSQAWKKAMDHVTFVLLDRSG